MGSGPQLWGAAALLLAGAALLWPGRALAGASARVVGGAAQRPLQTTVRDGSALASSVLRWVEAHSRRQLVTMTAAAVGGLAMLAGPLPAIAGLIAGACIGRATHLGVHQRAAARREAGDVEALQSLADELRAGQEVAAAMTVASESADSVLAPGLRAAASAVRFGADPGRMLVDESASRHAPQLAALYGLVQSRGAPLADAVDDLASLGRARLTQDRRIRSMLAGPSATAVLLCLLPGFGLVMGHAIGAEPLTFLTGSLAGGLVLIAGVTLACVGALWTQVMVANVRGST